MGIERTNSFHLLLSDEELRALRLLAERDGLNASDYLRTLLRREAAASAEAGHPSPFAGTLRRRDDLKKLMRVARAGAAGAGRKRR